MHAARIGAQVPQTHRHRVVIVDDHAFFVGCLRALLENESDMTVCELPNDRGELEDRIVRLRPDALVIDLSLGPESGLRLGRKLRKAHGLDAPILFTSSAARPSRGGLAAVGRCAFVAKSGRPAEFLSALRKLLARRGQTISQTFIQTELPLLVEA